MSKHVFPLILDGAVQPLSSAGSWNGVTSYVTAAGAGGAFTITLGAAEHAGTIVTVIKTDATNVVTVDPTTDFDSGSVASIALGLANESCTFIWTGESWRMFTQDQTNNAASFTGGAVANATTFANAVTVTAGGVDVNGGDVDIAAGTLHIEDGGAVTQTTSRTQGVTSATHAGVITGDATSLAAGASAVHTVTCAAVESAFDVVIVNKVSGDADAEVIVDAVAAGSFNVKVTNTHSSDADTTALVYNYVVIHGANS